MCLPSFRTHSYKINVNVSTVLLQFPDLVLLSGGKLGHLSNLIGPS